MNPHFRKHLVLWTGCGLVICLLISWIAYGLFGTYLIEALYWGQWPGISSKIMGVRADTPLTYYLQEVDRRMVVGTFWIVISFLALALVLKKPLGVILACCSGLLSFTFLFCVLEFFPFLLNSFRLDFIQYYAYRANYLPDSTLVYREKPRTVARLSNFRGHYYSPVYNVDVPPVTVDLRIDEEGFRNSHAAKQADIAVIGDSYTEYGDDEADTFGKRVEKKLAGLTVTNLGKAGYGPFQYLEVLKRYGINKKPTYVLLCFYEGNDLNDTEDYLQWRGEIQKHGSRRNEYVEVHRALTGNLAERYRMALMGTIQFTLKQIIFLMDLITSKLWEMRGLRHPEIAVVTVGNKDYQMLFRDIDWSKKIMNSTEQLVESASFVKLREILKEFKSICEEYTIKPIVVFIPNRTHIYGEYSTARSGTRWLRQWRERADHTDKVELLVLSLLKELKLEFIDLRSAFTREAKSGKMLYLPLDSHWNAEGRESAAVLVADLLKAKAIPSASGTVGQ